MCEFAKMSVGRWSASISLFPSPSGDFFFCVDYMECRLAGFNDFVAS